MCMNILHRMPLSHTTSSNDRYRQKITTPYFGFCGYFLALSVEECMIDVLFAKWSKSSSTGQCASDRHCLISLCR